MRDRPLLTAAGILAVLSLTAACEHPFGRQYEYEEQVYLAVTGAATVVIDASIPALVALRNLPLDPSASAQIDRDRVRALFAASGCVDPRVGQPWTRRGRRFVQIQLEVQALTDLHACAPLTWSTYLFEKDAGGIHYVQTLGPPSAGDPGAVNWTGDELVGFKLHAPSRIFYHNVRRLEDGEPGEKERGNILTWEQRLVDRRAGKPVGTLVGTEVRMEVRMGAESILSRTLWLFGGAFAAAVAVLVTLIWLAMRRAKRRIATVAPPFSSPPV